MAAEARKIYAVQEEAITVKLEALLLDALGGTVRLLDTRRGKGNVDPSGEAVLDVPLALAVADQHQSVDLRFTGGRISLHS